MITFTKTAIMFTMSCVSYLYCHVKIAAEENLIPLTSSERPVNNFYLLIRDLSYCSILKV